jgi:hypothetical protein
MTSKEPLTIPLRDNVKIGAIMIQQMRAASRAGAASVITVRHCSFINNSVSRSESAGYSSGVLTFNVVNLTSIIVEDSIFTNNIQTPDGSGFGSGLSINLPFDGSYGSPSNFVQLTRLVFINNKVVADGSSPIYSSALYLQSGDSVTMSNCLFRDNSIYIKQPAHQITAHFGGAGTAIYHVSASEDHHRLNHLNITRCRWHHNTIRVEPDHFGIVTRMNSVLGAGLLISTDSRYRSINLDDSSFRKNSINTSSIIPVYSGAAGMAYIFDDTVGSLLSFSSDVVVHNTSFIDNTVVSHRSQPLVFAAGTLHSTPS